MARRWFHYDAAFEQFLRRHTLPYIAVDEAKRALDRDTSSAEASSLKSFDFVVYQPHGQHAVAHNNLLIDVKGRRHAGGGRRGLQNWVTRADVEGLARWQRLFGPGFEAAFAFLYWYPTPPQEAWFPECFTAQGRWYALRVVRLADYQRAMKPRSPKWGTVDLPATAFADLAHSLGDLLGVACAAA